MAYPKYNTARGAVEMSSEPPFLFQGVTMRVLPLKAHNDRLQTFCDEYLNLMPPEIAYFRPAIPYVFLLMVNYGKMSSEGTKQGWVAQNEVLFSIWLDWYRKENGRLVYKDMASVCPFIFVDDEMSQVTGREVYGWPKTQGWLRGDVAPWAKDPRSRPHLLDLKSMVFREAYAGQRVEARTIVEMEVVAPPTFTKFPPDLNNPFNPILSVPRTIMNSMSVMGDMVDLLTALPIRGYAPGQAGSMPARIAKLLQNFNGLASAPFFNTINLKQFRDAELPGCLCYQSVINARMQVRRYHAGGMIGDMHLLRGDPSGGMRVKIHRYPSLPVIESFGLDVDKQYASETPIAILKPVFPFWIDLDLDYGLGEVICWRTRNSKWHNVAPKKKKEGDARERDVARAEEQTGAPHPYNTALGPALISVRGPFLFRNTSLRVLPLMADPECLKRFCDDYLNYKNLHNMRYEPYGSYVYLLVQNIGELASQTENIGQWAGRSLRFAVPVKWYDGDGNLVSLGSISPYVFVESQIGATTGRETIGWPTERAWLESPPNPWMDPRGPNECSGLLTLKTRVLSALNVGQEMKRETLLEIISGNALLQFDRTAWLTVAEEWGAELLRDLECKQETRRANETEFQNLKALALELLANGRSFNEIALKQFRHSAQPTRACYQAIVRSSQAIENLWDLREIEEDIHVRIYQQASQPIVKTLGLKVKTTELESSGLVYTLQPIRPFWMRVDLRTEESESLCWRTDTETWQEDPRRVIRYFQDPDRDHIRVGQYLVAGIESEEDTSGVWARQKKRQHLSLWTQEWLRDIEEGKLTGNRARRLTPQEARDAVEAVEPQMAMESLLSHEWGNRGNPRWYRNKMLKEAVEQKPDFCIRRDSVGPVADEVFPVPEDSTAFRSGERDFMGWYPVSSDSTSASRPKPRPLKKKKVL